MRKNESGYVLVVVAALLVVLIGFTALATDIGLLYSARTQSQRAADAAALAGAYTFIVNPLAPQPGTAANAAVRTAVGNTVMGQSIAPGEVSVNVDVDDQLVTVDIARSEQAFFARIFNIASTNVGVRAMAEAGLSATVGRCVKPWFIPNTIAAPPGVGACAACNNGQVLIDPAQPNRPSPYVLGNPALLGQPFTVKPKQGQGGGAIAPGQYYLIEVLGSGADPYREAIAQCSPIQYQCFDSYPVEPGSKTGPTRQGVLDLIGDPPDKWVSIGQYDPAPDGPPYFDTSKSLVIAPIVDLCSVSGFCPGDDFPTGSGTSLTVVGFALIFLDGMQGNNVESHLVNVFGCGVGGPSTPPDEATSFSIPIRLVRQ